MTHDFDERLARLGVLLPSPPKPLYNYVPALVSGNHVHVAGQLSFEDGALRHRGRLGDGATLEDAREAARLCGLNILAHVRNACGGTLNRVTHCLRMTGYVNSMPDCTEQPAAMDGCSNLMVEIFGERGRHVRTCVGVSSLPFNGVIVVEAVFEIVPGVVAP
ncbi:RidA family protein [Paraburkholderia sp. J12]|uniref:RidA family protein n=1 Tax=Paraburkholderia sp. J12 TaxID=2805432 RepID=UPI002ABE48B9|nr:RidA family protein [Paraburkholderia sp. J12]